MRAALAPYPCTPLSRAMGANTAFGKGMFARRGAADAKPGRRPDTLTELRWHQPLPVDGDSARAVSAAICEEARRCVVPEQTARAA